MGARGKPCAAPVSISKKGAKPMAKARTPKAPAVDPGLAMFESAQHLWGDSVVVDLNDIFKKLKGIPLRGNIPLQYVIGLDAVPVGRFFNVVGGWGVFKSSFCDYLGSLCILHDGVYAIVETENKVNPFQKESIIRHYINMPEDREVWKRSMMFFKAPSIEKLLQYNLWIAQYVEKHLVGKNIPVLCVNDSLGNVDLQNNVDILRNVEKTLIAEARAKRRADAGEDDDGKTGGVKGFSDARKAAMISQNMKAFGGNNLDGHLLSFIMLNHQKLKMLDPAQAVMQKGPPPTTESGGEHQRFQYSVILELHQGKKMGTTVDTTPTVNMRTKKSCFGSTGDRHINVPFKSMWIGGETGKEDMYFDWDMALGMLLTDEKELTTVQRNALKKLIPMSYNASCVTCPSLGLEDASKAALGAAIHGSEALSKAVQDILMIRHIPTVGTLRTDRLLTDAQQEQARQKPHAAIPTSVEDLPDLPEAPSELAGMAVL
jgi:hypothetical protein